ncbi:MAG: MarR family transcriptional regulator [Alphaproteobacteria bacterium]|nr:MarR family transcriptional regulator [Alphaproteobacteria bacterium]
MASRQFDLANSPGHLLRRAQQWAFDLYAKEVSASGLTPRQFTVLAAVSQRDGASQTELVDATGIDRSTLADMVARMMGKDLLARKRTEEDQRANAVRITAKGSRALKSAMSAVAKAESKILEPLAASKRGDFLKSLTAIAMAADAAEKAGANSSAPVAKAKRKTKAKPKAKR